MVVNPNVRALFRGVALREFTFQFKMIAESASEAEVIRQIVKHFRKEMYPDAFSANLADGVSADLGFKFPNVFKITFKLTAKFSTIKISSSSVYFSPLSIFNISLVIYGY